MTKENEKISKQCKLSKNDLKKLPLEISLIYKELNQALSSNLNLMAGFGIRAIIEAILNDKDIKGKNLYEKIETAEKEGFIVKKDKDMLQSLRLMGNDIVHELKVHESKILNSVFEIVLHLIKTVYIIPKFELQIPPEYSKKS